MKRSLNNLLPKQQRSAIVFLFLIGAFFGGAIATGLPSSTPVLLTIGCALIGGLASAATIIGLNRP